MTYWPSNKDATECSAGNTISHGITGTLTNTDSLSAIDNAPYFTLKTQLMHRKTTSQYIYEWVHHNLIKTPNGKWNTLSMQRTMFHDRCKTTPNRWALLRTPLNRISINICRIWEGLMMQISDNENQTSYRTETRTYVGQDPVPRQGQDPPINWLNCTTETRYATSQYCRRTDEKEWQD